MVKGNSIISEVCSYAPYEYSRVYHILMFSMCVDKCGYMGKSLNEVCLSYNSILQKPSIKLNLFTDWFCFYDVFFAWTYLHLCSKINRSLEGLE